jgi:hypothetical protein
VKPILSHISYEESKNEPKYVPTPRIDNVCVEANKWRKKLRTHKEMQNETNKFKKKYISCDFNYIKKNYHENEKRK